jgi:ribosomal protein S16
MQRDNEWQKITSKIEEQKETIQQQIGMYQPKGEKERNVVFDGIEELILRGINITRKANEENILTSVDISDLINELIRQYQI